MLITNNAGEKMEFKWIDEDIIYKNPYGVTNGIPNKNDFIRHNPSVLKIDGGMIIQVHSTQFDYLIDGQVVTQRAGASVKLLELMIKEKLKPLDYTHQHKISKMLENNIKG